MSKIYIPISSKKNLPLYMKQDFDGFLVGIEGFSSSFNNYVNTNELKEYIDLIKGNKKIYICLNRLYFNSEIDKVKDFLLSVKDLDIDGIFYTDTGVLNILNDIKYDKEIIWYSNHLGTNSKSLNFLQKKGVDSALISSEICLDEIIKIIKNTSIKVGVTLYGFLNMGTSSRKLLSNYFEEIDEKKNKNSYIIKDKTKDESYFLVEDKNTDFYTNKVLNGISFYPKLLNNNIDFIILDNFMLDENEFYSVIEAFSSLRNTPNDKELVNKLENVVDSNTRVDTFYGFLDKKTVYRVEEYGKN